MMVGMLLFLVCGGPYSCTCPLSSDGSRDDSRIQIRTRLRAHLPALMEAYPVIFPEPVPIVVDAGTDYRFRIIVPREKYVALCAEAAADNHAHNFKDEVVKRWGHADRYPKLLYQVWRLGYEAQEAERAAESFDHTNPERQAVRAKRSETKRKSHG